MRCFEPGRLILLAVAVFVVELLSLPGAAHAGQPPVAQQMEHDIHPDDSQTPGLGHCHGETSCSSGLHIVFGTRALMPDRSNLPAVDRAATVFDDTNLGREPPVPIAFL